MVRHVVFPGSFDPLTNGHVDVVERALTLFERVTVGVLDNPSKYSVFPEQERVELIRAVFKPQGERVTVASFNGLLVEFVRRHKADAIIRGLRAISDYDYEAQLALTNRRISQEAQAAGVETLFLITAERHAYVSSTIVRQVAMHGGDVSQLVPPAVAAALRGRFPKKV